jgi:hypothetical protein
MGWVSALWVGSLELEHCCCPCVTQRQLRDDQSGLHPMRGVRRLVPAHPSDQ